MSKFTLEDVVAELTSGEQLRVVQQNTAQKAPALENQNGLGIGDKLRNSLDNILSRSKQQLGIVASMVVGTGLLAASGLGLINTDNLTLKNSEPQATHAQVDIKNGTTEIKSSGILDNIKGQIQSVAKNVAAIDNKFPIFNQNHGKFSISDELKTSLEDAANFSVPAGFKENQVSRFVAQEKFKAGQEKKTSNDYLASLLSEGEGFRSNLYRDNIGLAYGIGWNVSMQSEEFNRFLMGAVNSNQSAINKIASFSKTPMAYPSGNYGTQDTVMPVQRHLQASLLIADKFKSGGVLPAFEKFVKASDAGKSLHKSSGQSYTEISKAAFSSLEPNIQAALVYHSYKVGEAGYGRYTTLNKKVVDYALTPVAERTLEQRKGIAEGIVYNYKLNGETLRDTRAEIKVAAMLVNPEIYGSMIKSNPAPKNINYELPQLQKNNVKVPTNANEEFVIPDRIGDLKREALENGKDLKLEMQYNYSDLNFDNPKPRKKGGMPAWG